MIQKILYEELEQVFDQLRKYHMKLLLGDFNSKLRRLDIFKPIIGNDSLRQDSNDNCVRIVNFPTSKIQVVQSTMFPHRNIHKNTIQNFTQHPVVRANSICTGNYWGSSVWISTQQINYG
jgi:hypothetical protein